MTTIYIDKTEFYYIKNERQFHCNEDQFVYVCKTHGENMGCCYCEFDYSLDCKEQH